MLHVNKIKGLKKQKGFSMLEGMFALMVFGGLVLIDYNRNNDIEIMKKSKIYSNQTYTYATQFSNYLNSSSNQLKDVNNLIYQSVSIYEDNKKELIQASIANRSKTSMKIISLNTYDNSSIYHQYPCLLLYYDNSMGQNEMMGLVYYVGDKVNYKDQDKVLLGSINRNPIYNMGYFSDNSQLSNFSKKNFNGNIISYNGFTPSTNIINYIKNNACVYNGKQYFLVDNSLMFNMQLMTDFNNKLISTSGIQRTTDQTAEVLTNESNFTNLSLLPGHIFNNNTLKSNLQVDNKVILKKNSLDENDPNNYNIQVGANNMLNFGKSNQNDNDTALLVSSIQPTMSIKTGTACSSTDVGKITIAGKETLKVNGNNIDLARNIVTCSKNSTLCSTGYCYVPIKQATYTFTNSVSLEDASGMFKCPSYAPYISTYTTSQGSPNVDVFRNFGGATTANSQLKNVRVDNGNNTWSNININPSNSQSLSRYYSYPSGSKWAFVEYMNFSDENIVHGTRDNLSYANVQKINGNTTLSVSSTWSNCSNICPNLNSKYGASWVDATTIYHVAPGRADINGTPVVTGGPSANRCTCAKMGGTGNDYYYGLAIIDYSSVHILAVTCSNYPNYQL